MMDLFLTKADFSFSVQHNPSEDNDPISFCMRLWPLPCWMGGGWDAVPQHLLSVLVILNFLVKWHTLSKNFNYICHSLASYGNEP